MNNGLITTSRNGSLANKRTNSNFPNFSSFLDDFFTSDFPTLFSPNFSNRMTTPMANVKENQDSFTVEMAAPGMHKKDFDINNQDNDELSTGCRARALLFSIYFKARLVYSNISVLLLKFYFKIRYGSTCRLPESGRYLFQ